MVWLGFGLVAHLPLVQVWEFIPCQASSLKGLWTTDVGIAQLCLTILWDQCPAQLDCLGNSSLPIWTVSFLPWPLGSALGRAVWQLQSFAMPFPSAFALQLSLKCTTGLLVLERQLPCSISILEQHPEGMSQRSFLVTVPSCVTWLGAELLTLWLQSCAASPLQEKKWL